MHDSVFHFFGTLETSCHKAVYIGEDQIRFLSTLFNSILQAEFFGLLFYDSIIPRPSL